MQPVDQTDGVDTQREPHEEDEEEDERAALEHGSQPVVFAHGEDAILLGGGHELLLFENGGLESAERAGRFVVVCYKLISCVIIGARSLLEGDRS